VNEFRLPHVLLIEDDEAQAYIVCRTIAKLRPYTSIHTVNNAASAREWLSGGDGGRLEHLRLIVLDLQLPDEDGTGLLRELKLGARTKRVPVAVLTVDDGDERVIETYGLGANSYLVKRSEADLVQAVEAMTRYWLELNEPPVGTGT